MTASGPSPWEDEAARWLAWTRTPGHDVFPYFAPAFFDEILPPPAGLTLEVGCGEGRVAREMRARGHNVVALDVSPTLARHARDADCVPAYVAGDATRLPFGDATFETVVAYNSLQTMQEAGDMARAVAEVSRVLVAGGRYCVCVAHPMTDVGRPRAPSDEPELVIEASYFDRRPVRDTVTKDGLSMTFHGWTYTLEDYVRALEAAGLLIERVREPEPYEQEGARPEGLAVWRRMPLFLSMRAIKTG